MTLRSAEYARPENTPDRDALVDSLNDDDSPAPVAEELAPPAEPAPA